LPIKQNRPTSFTVIIRCRDDFSTRTASSCGMLRKLRPFTSRIWSPTCRDGREHRGMAGGAEQDAEGGRGRGCRHARDHRSRVGEEVEEQMEVYENVHGSEQDSNYNNNNTAAGLCLSLRSGREQK
uniref:Uncharacterized protein n=1 Tax=Scophthalmus maximus TaxID=52904 RepID=A0A8D3AUN8_SCOMX